MRAFAEGARRSRVGGRLTRWAGVSVAAAILVGATLSTPCAKAAAPAAAQPPTRAVDSLWTRAQADSLQRLRDIIKSGHYAQAESSARVMLAGVQKTNGEKSLQAANVLDALVEALWRGGKASDPKSRELAERAVRIKEKALGPDHPDVARSLNNLANLLLLVGDYTGARPCFERALAIQEKALGPDHPDVARSLNNLANLLDDTGDYARARQLYERALAIREKALGPDHPDVAASLYNLGSLLADMGDHAGARPLYERALAIREKALGPDHPDVATSLNGLATLLEGTGEYAAARPLYERARAIWEKALGPEHPYVAMSLNNLAILRVDTGDYAGARPLYEQALAIKEKALGPDHTSVAASLHGLATLLVQTGDFAGARPLYERALAIWEKALGPDHPLVAGGLENLAILLVDTGDYAGAKQLYERALAIQEKALGPDHPDVAGTLENLANLLRDMGDYAGARPLYERALAIDEKALGPDHPDVARSLNNLAVLFLAQGRSREAVGPALRAETIGREHFRTTVRVLPERQALAFAVVRSTGIGTALSLLDSLPDLERRREVLDALVRSRALVLDEMASRHRSLRAPSDPEVDSLAAGHRAAATRFATLLVRGPDAAHPERYRPLLDQSRQEMEDAERRLSEKSAEFRLEQRARGAGLAEVASALPRRAALVAFASYQQLGPGKGLSSVPSYLAYVLRGGKESIAVVHLGAARAVDSLIARWCEEAGHGVTRRLPGQSEAAYRRAGQALRQKLWDPLTAHLRGIDRVFVVPDGAINLVSLATLPLDDGRYLIEKGPLIHYLSAERDLVTLDSLGEEGEGLLAMGGPAFDEQPNVVMAASGTKGRGADQLAAASTPGPYRGVRSGCGDFAALHFDSLPGTLREVQEIGQLWNERTKKISSRGRGHAPWGSGPVRELTGAQAGERAFKLDAPGHAVLHLATHGFFITGRCHSALEESERGIGALAAGAEQRPAAVKGENPLALSGLALAGANHRSEANPDEDDGILTAEEIAALDLGGVEWAVLSACETGVGDVRAGEGVFGLRRAFQVAGARTLIMSLWAVDDESARSWMRALYEARVKRKLGTAEALREASMTVLRQRRSQGLNAHPFYWGAFVAAGDWR
jgi:tetratricopeptide (TPR) repeat protein/CHAT domain-containing protein